MKISRLVLLFAVLLPVSAIQADEFGSETLVTIEGFYRLPQADKTTELKSGITRVEKSFRRVDVTNRTVLDALVKADLIPTAKDYSIVMVARNEHDSGVKFFAVRAGRTPVEIPGKFFSLNVSNGAATGVVERDNRDRLTRLEVTTYNYAVLTLPKFEGAGSLRQVWSMKVVETEQVQLVNSAGDFKGKVTSSVGTGMGAIELKLSGAKTVNLAKYGMATDDGGSGGGGIFGASATFTSDTLNSIDYSNFIYFAIQPNVTSITDVPAGTLSFNNTALAVPGLTFAFDGAPVSVATSTSNSANELTITTADGPVVYTREGDAVWTLVTPAADSVE